MNVFNSLGVFSFFDVYGASPVRWAVIRETVFGRKE